MLNEKQQEAIEMASENKIFLIKGAGGTGKTYVAKEIIYRLVDNLKFDFADISVLAPSHKAKEVLSEALNINKDERLRSSLGNEALIKLDTIQNYCGYKKNKQGNFVQMVEARTCHALLIDEVSMLSQDLWDIVKNTAGHIILLGDPDHQLPPPQSVVANFDDIPSIELTEQMRQVDTNDSLSKLIFKLRNYQPLTDINLDKSLEQVSKEKELLEAFHECNGTKILLSLMNEIVNEYNKAYKTEVILEPLYKLGDNLILQETVTKGKKTIFHSGDEVVIISILKNGSKGEIASLDRKASHTIAFTPNTVKHKFAQTIHKSQGSTYDHVFIDVTLPDYMDKEDIRRLLYVAFSRAREKATFFNPKNKSHQENTND